MLRLGKAAGNPRAEAIGYVAECAWRWAVLDDAAGESAILGLEAARDDIYRASNAFPLALALVSNARYAEARDVTTAWLPKMRANGNYWIAAVLEVMQCAADIALGRMSAGMRDLVRLEDELRERGMRSPPSSPASRSPESTYSSPAERSTSRRAGSSATPGSSPGTRCRPPAEPSRSSSRCDTTLSPPGFNGFLGMIDLSRAQIFATSGQMHRARDAVADVHAFLEAAGVKALSSAAVESIEAELGP